MNIIFKPSQTQHHQQTEQPNATNKQNNQTPPTNRTDGRHQQTEQTSATNKQNNQTPPTNRTDGRHQQTEQPNTTNKQNNLKKYINYKYFTIEKLIIDDKNVCSRN